MTASSPITMEDLINGLIFTDDHGLEWRVKFTAGTYRLEYSGDSFNEVNVSSDGFTITFGDFGVGGPTFTGFTFNA